MLWLLTFQVSVNTRVKMAIGWHSFYFEPHTAKCVSVFAYNDAFLEIGWISPSFKNMIYKEQQLWE